MILSSSTVLGWDSPAASPEHTPTALHRRAWRIATHDEGDMHLSSNTHASCANSRAASPEERSTRDSPRRRPSINSLYRARCADFAQIAHQSWNFSIDTENKLQHILSSFRPAEGSDFAWVPVGFSLSFESVMNCVIAILIVGMVFSMCLGGHAQQGASGNKHWG